MKHVGWVVLLVLAVVGVPSALLLPLELVGSREKQVEQQNLVVETVWQVTSNGAEIVTIIRGPKVVNFAMYDISDDFANGVVLGLESSGLYRLVGFTRGSNDVWRFYGEKW